MQDAASANYPTVHTYTAQQIVPKHMPFTRFEGESGVTTMVYRFWSFSFSENGSAIDIQLEDQLIPPDGKKHTVQDILTSPWNVEVSTFSQQ